MKKPDDQETVRKASLEEWFERVQSAAAASAGTGSERGACLVADPAGGPAMCVFVDRETCRRIRGTFIGGPC